VVWFASIVAAVLYALGFAAFAVVAAQHRWGVLYGFPLPGLLPTGRQPGWPSPLPPSIPCP
jgi:hypothetical protein